MGVTLKPENFGDLPALKQPQAGLAEQWYKRDWPLTAALLILWVTVGVLTVLSLQQEQRGLHPPYALDDAYIHMAIAKNLVQHGVWGVTRYKFSSASSSILWPLLLSATYLFTKVNEYAPFALNLLFASLILIVSYYGLRKYRVSPLYLLGLLLAIIFLTPLPTLIFDGMEHTLHILLLIVFVNASIKILTHSSIPLIGLKSAYIWLWLAMAALATMARYESLFVVGIIGALLILRRRWLQTVALAIVSGLPVLIFGLISVANGSEWLPNSLVLKSHTLNFNLGTFFNFFGYVDFKGKEQIPLLVAPHLLTLAIAALLVYRARFGSKGFWNGGQLRLIIFGVTAFLHLQLAGISWFYRYEDYVVILGLLALAYAWFEDWHEIPSNTSENKPARFKLRWQLLPKYAVNAALIFVLLLPLTDRGVRALALTPQATTNIYEQQYQMGLFLRQFYTGAAVAANDIGAINYLADIRCIDLSGLGTLEITRLIKQNAITSTQVDTITHAAGVKIAIVSDGYGAPPDWIAVGRWHTPNSVVSSAETVWFYAVDKNEEVRLRTALTQFGPNLPGDVQQTILPTTH